MPTNQAKMISDRIILQGVSSSGGGVITSPTRVKEKVAALVGRK
jgi:hypothetical protein